MRGYDGDQVLLTFRPEPDAGSLAGSSDATLTWTTERGVFRAPAVVTGDGRHVRVSLRGAVARVQRREYIRLPMQGPMTLSHGAGVERATLADLSEAALRVRLSESGAQALHPGDEVQAAFTLHQTGFMLRGTVLRAQPGDDDGAVDVIVVLDIPARTANELRRNVVFEQVQRRSKPDGRDESDPAPR